MNLSLNHKLFSIILIILSIISFFLGFYFDEVSMGAGGYNGDFKFVQKSIDLFHNNSIKDSILLFTESSNRPPLIYILHKLFNPFFNDLNSFRLIVFLVSLLVPILLFFCFKEKFKKIDNIILLLFTSIIFFNPFFRTSSFWGLEENYSYITLLLSLLYLLKLKNGEKKEKKTIYFELTMLTFFSSLCLYFDQKFLIIPLISFIKIITSNLHINFKLYSTFLYFIFAIPFIYLISIWGGIFPSDIYYVGQQFYIHHIGFVFTMIAFIIFPFFILASKLLKKKYIESFLKDKINYISLLLLIFYIILLIFFYDNSFMQNRMDGGGVIKKISFLLFEDILLRKTFIYISFLISGFVIILFLNKNLTEIGVITYFILIALITSPFYQEYIDPFLFFIIFFLFDKPFELKFKNGLILYVYFLIFLTGSINYYNFILNT